MQTQRKLQKTREAKSARSRSSNKRALVKSSSSHLKMPPDLLSMLVTHLKSPRQLIIFSMVCRASRDAILKDFKLWLKILEHDESVKFRWGRFSCPGPAVVRDIPMTPYPNFKFIEGHNGLSNHLVPLRWFGSSDFGWPHLESREKTAKFTDAEVEALAKHAIHRARVEAFRQCGFCGSSKNTLKVWGLGRKVCSLCLKNNLISSAVLYEEFGIVFTDHMRDIPGSVFYFKFSDKRSALHQFTHNRIDFKEIYKNHHVFFWKPHLCRLFDLEACRRNLLAKKASMDLIQAKVRALCVRLVILQKTQGCGCGKLFHGGTCHNVFLNAKAEPNKRGHYSVKPCGEGEAKLVKNWLPMTLKTRLLMEPETRAYRILQTSFLAFRGRSTLPHAVAPETALEHLRQNEAVRSELLHKWNLSPCWTKAYLQWRDIAPTC